MRLMQHKLFPTMAHKLPRPVASVARRWTVWSIVGCLALGALAAGCGGGDDGAEAGGGSANGAASEPKTIHVNHYTPDLPFYHDRIAGMKDKAEELGWTIEEVFGDSTPITQVNQIETAVSQQVDAIVVSPIDEQAPIPAVRTADAAGIPVFTAGNRLASDLVVSEIGADYSEMGRLNAEYVAEQLGGSGVVATIHGIRGVTFTEDQIDGLTEVFSEYPEIEVLEARFADGYSADVGVTETENLLTARQGEIDAILFDSDDLAVGGIKALRERNIDMESVVTTGVNGSPAGLRAVRNGHLDQDISLCGHAQGIQIVELLEQHFAGEELESEIASKVELINPDNIEEKTDTGALDPPEC